MPVNPNLPPQGPVSAVPQQKRKGSGFVNFDRVADENKAASQSLGNQIQSNINQNIQAVQGQTQGQVANVQGQVAQENQRLSAATQTIAPGSTVQNAPGQVQGLGGVAGQLSTDPMSVNKDQYKSLTSGKINAANTADLQNMQGQLGSTAQVAKQLSSSPTARQETINTVTKRPVAMQSLSNVQKNLDSALLGRNVNTQQQSNQAARAAFQNDRNIQSELKNVGAQTQAQQAQALQNRDILRGARTNTISEQQRQAEEAANKYNTETKSYLDYLNSDELTRLLSGEVVGDGKLKLDEPAQQEKLSEASPANPSTIARDRFLTELLNQGIDPNALDITDLGTAGAVNLIRQGEFGATPITSEQALTDTQRARLKALYGLEDELQGKDYLNQAYVAPTSGVDFAKLKEASAASAAATAAAKAKYDQGVADFNANYARTIANPYLRSQVTHSAGLGNLFRANVGNFDARIDARAQELAAQEVAKNPDFYKMNPQVDPAKQMRDQATTDVTNQLIDSDEGRKAILASMEEAARQNFDQSVTIDDIGKMFYGGGGAAGMAAVREAFNPYIQRKVQTLGGGTINPTLQGGAYTGPGLGQHNLAANSGGGFGNIFSAIGTNLGRIGEMAGNLTSASNPVGNVVRNVAGGLTGGIAPAVLDEIKRRQLGSTIGALSGGIVGQQLGSGFDDSDQG